MRKTVGSFAISSICTTACQSRQATWGITELFFFKYHSRVQRISNSHILRSCDTRGDMKAPDSCCSCLCSIEGPPHALREQITSCHCAFFPPLGSGIGVFDTLWRYGGVRGTPQKAAKACAGLANRDPRQQIERSPSYSVGTYPGTLLV